jgi:5-(aminomethyl)-3-furanmethanol phosphate kinase
VVDIVVKVGGGLLAHVEHFLSVLVTINSAARGRQLLVVPGGGPFADAVRDVDRRLQITGDAAHWMAVLAMDQYAYAIADRLGNSAIVEDRAAIAAALDARRVPVLAPYRWLREADPLPHSWDVTSDSIAAWVAGEVGARRLVLIKPPGALRGGRDLVDAHFSHAVPTGLEVITLGAEQTDAFHDEIFG